MKSSQFFRCLKSDTSDISLRLFRFSEASCPLHRTSRCARDFRSTCFFFLLLFLTPLGYSQTPPETTIISGPSGIIGYEDITFWWVGSTPAPQPPNVGGQGGSRIVGYYYELDSQGRIFTEANRVTFFGMAEGAHTFRIRTVDTNGLEDETPDERSFQVSPGRQVEIEPNNVSSLANVLQPNLQVGGSSADAQDIDWYQFQIPSNIRQAAICLKRTSGIGETTAKVYRGFPLDASKIAEFTINSANAQRQCVTLGVGAGDYFINIQAKTVDTNFVSYVLTVVHVLLIDGVNWDTERNDTFESANALPLPPSPSGGGAGGEGGAAQTLTLIGDRNFTGDTDWFKLHVSARQQLRLVLDRPGAAGDTVIDIYRSPLFSGDITGRQIGRLKAGALTGQHAEFQTTVTLGDYFLKVDNGSESNNQPYIVSLTLTALPEETTTEIEPNSISPFIDPTAGSPLPFSRTVTGTSWDSNADIDWFRVGVPPSAPTDQSFLSLSFARPLGIGSTGLEVFNPNSLKIGELTVSTTNAQQGQIALPVKGGPVARDFASLNMHGLKLTPQGESVSAEYRLIATFVQSLTHDAKEPLALGEPLTVSLLMPQGIAAVNPSFELVGNFASEIAAERTRRIPLPFLGVDAATGGRRNVGRYVPVSGDDVTDARVVVRFFDLTGGEVVIPLPQPITIDTIAPKIESISHNGVSSVRVAGERLTITLTGDMDAQAQFEIIDPITQTAKIRIPPSAIRKTGSSFEASYTITATDEVVAGIVVGRLVDAAGNATTIQAESRATIRASAPKIIAASHDGRVPLGRGAKLTVTMTASPGGSATFSIDTAPLPAGGTGWGVNRPMFDDGKHSDGAPNDGVYAGTYTVAAGDDFTHAQITVRFTDAREGTAELNLPEPVTLDGTAPDPVLVTRAIDVPDDEGFALLIEWAASSAPDLSHYNIYLDGRPIRSLVGLSPALTELVTTRANLPVKENNTPFFLAVTAVDRLGNESANPSESGAGPVRALDNLPPEPVIVVTAADTPDDFGGSVTVSWTQPSASPDFDHYNLYTTASPNLPIVQFPGFPLPHFFTRTPTVVDVPTPADNVDLFFVVTAVDGSGNESMLRPESIAGPVRSIANVEIQPAGVLHFDSGPVGLIRYNDVIFRWNRLETGNYLYQLDERPPQQIADTRLILRDLERGAHRFIIQTATDSVTPSTGGAERVERQFTVAESTLTENEPNDSPDQATTTPVGWTVTGRLSQSDRDYYRLAIKKRGVVDLHYTQRAGESPAESLDGETNLQIYRESITPSNQVAEAKIDAANRSRSISFGAAPGNYIIFIDNQSSATEVRQSTYELSAAFSPGDRWEIEPNNDGITATPLPALLSPPGERLVRGTSWHATDTDWYRIDVSQTGRLIINFLRESLGGETTIALHDAGGQTITTRTQSTNAGIGTSLSAPVSRGNYFVEVTPKNVDAFSEYRLMATQIGGAEFRIDDGTGSPPKSQLTLGDRLIINLQWMGEGKASFSLGGIQSSIPLLRLGTTTSPPAPLPAGEGGNGFYRATFPIPDGLQLSDVPVVVRLIEVQGVAFDFELTPRLAIDTVTSPIASIEHDATAPLVEGKMLTVTLTGSSEASVTYEVIDAETEAVLIPTSRFQPNPPAPFPPLLGGVGVGGKGGLLPSPPGEGPGERSQQYTATYTVRDGDFVANGRVRGTLTKPNGRTVSATATRRVQIDALPPEPVAGVTAVDRPSDEGRTLQVTWSPASAPDIAEYEIYLQRQAFSKGKIVGASPALRVRTTAPPSAGGNRGGAALPVESNGVDYFVAIIAVDGAGNRSVIGESSSAGPVRAIDNLPPEAVRSLTAFDTPDDAGEKVTLQWTHPSGAIDFDHYNIYRSEQPFTSAPGREVVAQLPNRNLTTIDVPTPFDDVDLYFSITAVDPSGNESPIVAESSFGPVRSVNNLTAAGESSVRITAGPSGLIRHNDVIFHWNRWRRSGAMTRYIYRLDNQPPQSTTDTAIAFFNLLNGAHRFYLRAADESIEIERPFTVSVTTLAESEPNNTSIDANPIEVGVTHIGTLTDVDLYRLDVDGRFPGLPAGGAALRVDLIYTQREGETEIKVFQNFISDEAQIGQTLVNPATRGRGVLSFAVSPATYLIALDVPGQGVGTRGNGIPYEFSVSISPVTEPDLVELEPNATPSRATPLPLNRSITGTSWDGSKDIDYYRVEVAESGILWLGLTRPDGVGSTKLTLRDGSGGEIGSTQISSNSLQSGHLQVGAIHELPLQRGSYTVQISPENERSGSVYQLAAFFARSAKHELVGSPGVARPLRLGEKLRVTVDAAADLRTEFEIIDARTQAVIVPSSRFVVTTSVVPPYKGEYTVVAGDNFEGATVVVRLTNANGVTAALSVGPPITVDTVPPVIQSVSHNATNPDLSARPLRLGDELTVTLIGEAGGKAFFAIETSEVSKTSEVFSLGVSVPLIESKEARGHYAGTYKIREVEHAHVAQVKVTLIDAAGNATSQTLSPPLSIDTIPPSITSVRHNATKILSDSDELIVTLVGEAGGRASFDIVGVIDSGTGEPPVPLVIEGVRLFDDGGHNDGAANDGVYVGTYRVRPGDHALNATVVGHLVDAVGNASTLSASETSTIDTLPPQIEAIEHDATAPLALGEILTVKLVGEANAEIRFEIINADTGAVLLPPSKFQVVTQRVEGKEQVQYIATYTVREGDDIANSKVRATLTKRNGKSATRTALLPITIDTVPPPPMQGVTAVDRPDDEGGFIHLSWRPSHAADFDHYNIYQQDTPISQPVVTTLVVSGTTQVVTTTYEVKVDRNGVDFYFAVTVVDKAGNESLLARGADGSIAMGRAIDNLPPPSVLGVTAIDSPNDFGGRVTLAWLSPNPALDFAQYRIYLSPLPITTTTGLRPIVTIPDRHLINVDVPTPSDDFDYYFAVTAVDISGNESIFGTGSATGPVQSHNNIGIRIETPVQIVSGPIGLVRQKSVTFHWSSFNLQPLPPLRFAVPYEGTGGEGSPRYAFRLDDAPFQFTPSNQMTFYNLREGVHTFSVKLAEGDSGTATRTFSVLPTFTTEVEPNDTPGFANPLTVSAIVRGANSADSDEDWYQLTIDHRPSTIDKSLPLSVAKGQLTIDLHIERPAGIGQTIVSVFDVDSPQESAIISEVRANAATRQRAQLSLGVNGQTNGLLVRVRSEGENPGAGYELSLAIMQRDVRSVLEVERNDMPNFATVLPNPLTPFPTREGEGFEIVGRADRSNDVDWYQLTIDHRPSLTMGSAGTSPALVSITLSTAGSLTTTLKAYAGTRISPDNQIGELELSSSNPGQNHFTTAVAAGTYLLSVENGDIATGTAGALPSLQSALNYRIFVQFHDIPAGRTWELEPNGSRANATPIVIDSRIYGTSWHPNDDLDWFRLPIQQHGILGVGLHRPNGIGVTEMRLTDAGGNELTATMTDPITNRAFISLDVLPGTYYIQLNPESEDTVNAYVLTPVLIRNASHNAVDTILGRESELIVTLDWVPGRTATFHIESNKTQKGGTSGTDLSPAPSPFVQLRAGSTRGGELQVPMIDQGNGTYVGKYKVPPDVQIVKGEVIIDLGGIAQVERSEIPQSGVDNVPDTVQIRLKEPVTIDTLPPQITQVRHDAVKPSGEVQPIGLGKTIHIRLVSEPGGFGKFRIESPRPLPPPLPSRGGEIGEGFLVNGDLFDDGAHEDDAPNDGVYGGSYTVRLGDNVTDAKLTGILEDLAGNVAELESVKTVMFDTQPPPITALTYTVTRPEVQDLTPRPPSLEGRGSPPTNLLAGDLLTVTLVGEIGGEAEFDLGTLLSSVRLFDDGTHGDQRSNDGVYTNTYVVRASDTLANGVITGRLRDRAGNENENTSPILINIDTTPPSIQTIEHNATHRPLIAGARLIVRLRGEPNGTATFDIGSFKTGLIMVDDGSGVDEKANDGIYTGLYEIKPGDNAHDAVISGRLVDESGNQTIARAAVHVTIDAAPPPAIIGVTAADGPNDQGNVLIVTWNAPESSAPPSPSTGRAGEGSDFARYHIFREAAPIRSTFGLIPLSLNLVVREQTIAQITVPRNNFDYYIAVTAVDPAGNESMIANDSTFGPVRALDNIPPPPILGVKAENKPNDNGKTIIVRWAPLPNLTPQPPSLQGKGETPLPVSGRGNDFARYQIYVDTQPIANVENLTPQRAQGTAATLANQNTIEADVPVPADKINFYVAVTAVDENGNESALDLGPDGSTFGPVQSRDEIPPDPVLNVVAIDTPGDQGKSLTVAWTAQIGVGVSHYLIYLSASPIRSAEDLKDIKPMRADGERTDLSTVPTSVDNLNFYIIVTAVDFGDNVSALQPDGGSVAGPVQSVSNTIRLTTPTTISAGFDPRTQITVPPRAAQSGQTIDIFIPSDETLLAQIDEANHFVAEAHIDEGIDATFQGTVREFVLTSRTPSAPDEKFSIPAELTLSYPVQTKTPISPEIEADLRIFRLNTKGRVALWELVPGVQRVNRETKTVTVPVDPLTTSIFRVARLKLPNNLKDVVVYPNPFIPGQSGSKRVIFLNLTANATIEIYTLNGERVWSKTVEASAGTATWDGRNDSGMEVASGLYIYLIRSDVDKAVGRIMVMR